MPSNWRLSWMRLLERSRDFKLMKRAKDPTSSICLLAHFMSVSVSTSIICYNKGLDQYHKEKASEVN